MGIYHREGVITMFKSNIKFEGGPTDLQILQELEISLSHCCYCDPSACSPSLTLGTCDACKRMLQE